MKANRNPNLLEIDRPEDALIDANGAADESDGDNGDNVDGRTRRRQRNRTAVIDAMLAMIREGDLHPAAADIADRAGVSHRSIFRYFDDLDDLVRTTIDRALEEAAPYRGINDLGMGTTAERIDAYVDARIALYDHVDTMMQVAQRRADDIPSITEGFAAIVAGGRVQIRKHFAPEVETADPGERDDLVDAILVAASYESYSIHVRLMKQDHDRLRSAWRTSLTRLLR